MKKKVEQNEQDLNDSHDLPLGEDVHSNNNNNGDNNMDDESAKMRQSLENERHAKLLVMADFDNYRKRTEMERSQLITIANLNILRELADLVDDFERMITDLEMPGVEDKIDAFKPVLDKAKGIMIDNGLVEIVVNEGDKFNPQDMEAIGTVEVEENEVNLVKHVAQRGYKFADGERILRHARVIVGKLKANTNLTN